ncbi:MAG: DUF4164 family protein [Geminicoccaceae bacterium]|nr:DUF4164 family protein [Geminicoccaceae bacterium]
MSALTRAQTRLEQAVARLEHAVSARSESLGEERASLLDREVGELRDECRDLRSRLEATTRRHARMQDMVTDVAGRLDGAIGELDQLLGR